jgi:hypothetical protein
MQPMSNMLTLNYRKSLKMEMRKKKIEMSNMLIEKERKRKENLEKNSVCYNER